MGWHAFSRVASARRGASSLGGAGISLAKNNLAVPKGTARKHLRDLLPGGYYWTVIVPTMPASLWPGCAQ